MALLSLHIDRDELASKLGGGLPQGSLLCLEGPPAAGKSVVCQRLAYGLLQNGHRVAYVSTELTTQGFAQQMASLDYRVETAMIRGDLLFIPVFPLLGGGQRPRGDLLERLMRGRHLFEREVVIVDTFSKLVEESSEVLEPALLRRRLADLLYFVKRLTATGRTVLLTLEPDPARTTLLRPFHEASDLLFQVQAELAGNTVSRRIVVQRMSRASSRFNDVLGFRVEPGVGLVVEIKSVV